MNLFKSLLIVFLSTSGVVFAQTSKSEYTCKILKDIRLKYLDAQDSTAYIVIKNNKHIEYLEGGKYYIKSDLNWVNDCEYNATMTEITLPKFPYKPGEIMNVKFQKIENGIISAIATVQNISFLTEFKMINK